MKSPLHNFKPIGCFLVPSKFTKESSALPGPVGPSPDKFQFPGPKPQISKHYLILIAEGMGNEKHRQGLPPVQHTFYISQKTSRSQQLLCAVITCRNDYQGVKECSPLLTRQRQRGMAYSPTRSLLTRLLTKQ